MTTKWVYFAQELLRPFYAAPGEVKELPLDQYLGLKEQAKEGFIFDVTPSPFCPLIWHTPVTPRESNCELIPCEVCMMRNQYGQWYCHTPMTKCRFCDDLRTVVASRTIIPVSMQVEQANRLKELFK